MAASSDAPARAAGLLDRPSDISPGTPSQLIPGPPAQQAAAQPLTPLQLRQWQRAAQRSVRLALTAFKAGRTTLQEATEQGTAAATQLTNALLTAQYMPAMQLPEALQAVQGLKPAAVRKLRRQQQQHLQVLSGAVQQAAAAVAAMEAALAGVLAQLGSEQQQEQQQGSQVGTLKQSESQAAAPMDPLSPVGPCGQTAAHSTQPLGAPPSPSPSAAAGQRSRTPVFHILSLPQAAGMLQRVLHMHQQDAQLKQSVYDSFAGEVLGSSSDGGHGVDPAGVSAGRVQQRGQAAGEGAAEVLRRRLTVLITCWLSKPHVDEEEALQLLQVLTVEMTGF